MSKLSLEELQNTYRDRDKPQVAEVVAVIEPTVSPVEVPVAPAPVSSNRSSNAPLVTFLVLSGMTMFVGLVMLVTGDTSSVGTVQDELVLGESTTRTERQDESPVESLTNTKKETKYIGTEIEEPIEELPVIEEAASVEVIEIVRIKPNEYNGVNLRVAPDGQRMARAISGEEFEFVSEDVEWTEVRFDADTTYWVLSELVEKV